MKMIRQPIGFGDAVFKGLLTLASMGVLVIMGALVLQLFQMAWAALASHGLGFFWSKAWNPITEQYGALAFAYGTVMSSLVALLIAVPVSLGAALFLTEIAPRRVSMVVGFLVEMLAAIPSVVYGLWGIFVLAPWLRTTVQPFLSDHFGFLPIFQGPPYGVGMLAAGIILAIMITPTIAAVSREVFRSISNGLREGAKALGATRWETIRLAVLKSSHAGLVGAVMLGLGRALGETMAVTMVIGNRVDISASLFSPAQTMASVIANEYAEATSDLHLSALAAVGLALFFVSLITNGLARLLARHTRG